MNPALLAACMIDLSLGTGLAQPPDPPTAASTAPAASPEIPAAEPAPAQPVDPPPVDPPPVGPAPIAYPPGPGVYAGPSPQPEPAPRRLVFAFLPSLTMGIAPLPSAAVSLFLGARLPRGPWALGYQLTLSSGLAERYSLGVLTHRHHITAMRSFASSGRGFASVGGGAAFLATSPVVEVEGRVGFRFGTRRRGVLAALMRVGWDIGHHERAPMPQFGVVIGFAFL